MSTDFDLYTPVVAVVRGYCRMYHYMTVTAEDPRVRDDVREHFSRVTAAIHDALTVNCRPDEAPYFLDDIGLGTGFNKSQMCFISEVDYKVRKRKIVHDIAVNLRLVEE